MSSVNSVTPINEELSHHLRDHSDNQFPAIPHVANGYHHRNPGKPIKALWEALKDNMSLDIVIAIIADLRCGLERRSTNGDGFFTFSSSQKSSWGNSAMRRIHGEDGYTPLFLAVLFGRYDVVGILLAKEADVHGVALDCYARTLLHFAALYNRTACAELLIAEGADVLSVPKLYNVTSATIL